ncbi:hypothetical protein BDP27DRAFT_1430822 [Rhodocollybia butyracea]|uniref:Uncharacterized protein n=1 Tax=Rhodocollybia butyracea TaxID=206335 RepID=A0A9P5PAX4_9AGAR|nr:hypothetical protein BDP27DRAFT_1430822 [Rhodocollybia butyracea]
MAVDAEVNGLQDARTAVATSWIDDIWEDPALAGTACLLPKSAPDVPQPIVGENFFSGIYKESETALVIIGVSGDNKTGLHKRANLGLGLRGDPFENSSGAEGITIAGPGFFGLTGRKHHFGGVDKPTGDLPGDESLDNGVNADSVERQKASIELKGLLGVSVSAASSIAESAGAGAAIVQNP